MPSAEIITIGTEILLGEIVDTNAPYIARLLRDAGVDLYRKTSVGDNPQRIAQVIREALARCDVVITTGGLGPTVDDPTRQAVALAVGVETELRPDLWEQIQARFRRYNRVPTENNKRQAYVPVGSIAVENPVGTAPSFIVEVDNHSIFSLPGVPREMEYLMQHAVLPYLREHYQLKGIIKSRLVHTAGVGESQIDDLIGDLEELANPTVGLSAHAGQVDIRITAKATTEDEAEVMINQVEDELRRRLEEWIYGVDAETLEQAALAGIIEAGWNLVALEAGLNGELIRRLSPYSPPFIGGQALPIALDPAELNDITFKYRRLAGAQVALGISLRPAGDKQDIHLVLLHPSGVDELYRPYGGPPGNSARFAVNIGINMLRETCK